MSSSSQHLERTQNMEFQEQETLYSLDLKERVIARTVAPSFMASLYEEPLTSSNLDWVLKNYDEKNSEPQSVEEELNRLQALRSYLILDNEREHQFERLTALASRVLKVPIALVSLVDLGRQWFMSNRGLGDVRETPRSQAFCSHAIVTKDDLLIIKDTQLDPRFVDNPLVTGPPYIRFYAGAPLETPEGYKLGTFCIIDTKPWPDGLDLDSKQNLKELASMAMEVMVARRRKRDRDQINSSQLIASTAHDLLTPLSGIELSLHLLKEDLDFQRKMTESHKHVMKGVKECSNVIQEICTSVRSTYAEIKSSFEKSLMMAHLERVEIDKLVDRLHTVMETMQKKVPVKIVVDNNVPKILFTDPTRIIRGAINYLSLACQRTVTGMIALRFFFRQEAVDTKNALLFVVCEDTAPPVRLDVYQSLFKPVKKRISLFEEQEQIKRNNSTHNDIICPELCLFSVACEMNIVGGEYGFRPRTKRDTGCELYDKEMGEDSGSSFWFCIPCTKIEESSQSGVTLEGSDRTEPIITHKDASRFHESLAGRVSHERKKRALVIEDSNVVRKMLTKILTKLDFEVSQAENGMEGLEKLKSTLFDLTLCDFLMPIMDGLDCVQQYRDWEKYHRPWLTQRIVGISAHATQGDIERGMKVGMDDYKNKPVTFQVLSELVKCKKQVEMSMRLDEIDKREATWRNEEGGSVTSTPQNRKDSLINVRPCACLVIAPAAEGEHVIFMQDRIKTLGWQSTTASSDAEALTWLRMRMWDLVLADETFGSVISLFREWESKKRKTPQKRVILMIETTSPNAYDQLKPPDGIDGLTGKPISMSALDKLLHSTLCDVNQEAKE